MAKSGKGISIGIQDFKYAVLKDDGTYTPFMDVPNVLTVADTPDTKDSKKFYGDNGEIHSVQPTSKTGSLVLSFAHGLNSSFYEEVYGWTAVKGGAFAGGDVPCRPVIMVAFTESLTMTGACGADTPGRKWKYAYCQAKDFKMALDSERDNIPDNTNELELNYSTSSDPKWHGYTKAFINYLDKDNPAIDFDMAEYIQWDLVPSAPDFPMVSASAITSTGAAISITNFVDGWEVRILDHSTGTYTDAGTWTVSGISTATQTLANLKAKTTYSIVIGNKRELTFSTI